MQTGYIFLCPGKRRPHWALMAAARRRRAGRPREDEMSRNLQADRRAISSSRPTCPSPATLLTRKSRASASLARWLETSRAIKRVSGFHRAAPQTSCPRRIIASNYIPRSLPRSSRHTADTRGPSAGYVWTLGSSLPRPLHGSSTPQRPATSDPRRGQAAQLTPTSQSTPSLFC